MSEEVSAAENSHENSRNPADHLKQYQWKPGDPSPNPGGRPKKKPITEAYEKALEDPETCRQIVAAALQQILKGNGQVLKEVTDRVEGKVSEKVEHSGADGGPINLVINFKKPNAK